MICFHNYAVIIFFYFSFRYQWEAVGGTYFYNSFTALQRMDGFSGRGIVREAPEDEPHSKLYDYDLTEHSILIQEYAHRVKTNLCYYHLGIDLLS